MVKKGDTLYEIAKKYNVELDKLIELNPQIADPNVIDAGMKVKIPNAPKPVVPPTDFLYKHVVVQGDTLWKLGKAWNVPLHEMIEANPHLKNPNVLMTGEAVYIPKLKTPSNPHKQPYVHPYNPKADTSIITPAEPSGMVEAPQPAVLPEAPQPAVLPEAEQPAVQPEPAAYPSAQLPPMPDLTQGMQMPQEPYTDLFQQYQVPATEVMSFDFEAWKAPQLPPMPEMPSADSMPYEHHMAAMPAFMYPQQQQPFYNDCGCGGPAYPSYQQGIPYPYAPNMEYPASEHPAFVQPGYDYPQAHYMNMMMPGMEAPCFPLPHEMMATTSAYPGPVYPMHAYPAFPAYESPFGPVKKDCNCGCHDRAIEQAQPVQQAEAQATISKNEEKVKIKSAKSKKRAVSPAEAALRRLAQKNRGRAGSSNGRGQLSPWINV
jgi:morphogenetic protein associated with SpoVID